MESLEHSKHSISDLQSSMPTKETIRIQSGLLRPGARARAHGQGASVYGLGDCAGTRAHRSCQAQAYRPPSVRLSCSKPPYTSCKENKPAANDSSSGNVSLNRRPPSSVQTSKMLKAKHTQVTSNPVAIAQQRLGTAVLHPEEEGEGAVDEERRLTAGDDAAA